MIPELRSSFNSAFSQGKHASLLARLEQECGTEIDFRVAETPVFVPEEFLHQMAREGEVMARALMESASYMAAARQAIPPTYRVANETDHPHFLTADFALIREADGSLAPRLVEIQAFPSVFGYQALACSAYREVFDLPQALGTFLGGLNEAGYWQLLAETVLGGYAPEEVVLAEVDPLHQKTLPDFAVTAKKLGIAVVDIASLEPVGDTLHYRNSTDRLVPIHRIYNRAIADELIARKIWLNFDLTRPWNVEWAGHPNWYFLISKFSIPWLTRILEANRVVPPAVFLSDFLEGTGRADLASAGVPLPAAGAEGVYEELLLKPLFSFAGRGIEFAPSQARLESIPADQRAGYLLQQKMQFEPTIATPHGLTQAEFRILYMWPDGGRLTPTLSLVRLGRGKMMGVDHNRNQEWVGASAAFFPESPC